MVAFRVAYDLGMYRQSDLDRRKRLKDDDVACFIRYWMQGRDPGWIGRDLGSVTGVPLSAQMVRSHAARMEAEGFIPEPHGRQQPHWQDFRRLQGAEAAEGPPVVSADPRGPRGVRRALAATPTWRPSNAGRPPRAATAPEGITASPRQYPGTTWREAARRRREDEANETRQATIAAARERRQDEGTVRAAAAIEAKEGDHHEADPARPAHEASNDQADAAGGELGRPGRGTSKGKTRRRHSGAPAGDRSGS